MREKVQVARVCTVCGLTYPTYYQGKDFQCNAHRTYKAVSIKQVVKVAIATAHITHPIAKDTMLQVPIGCMLKEKTRQ
jgi:hypothetical protein